MRPVIFACLLTLALWASAPQCLAQSFGDAKELTAEEEFRLYHTGSPTVQIDSGSAPILQGATNGTIGPPRLDAPDVSTMNSEKPERLPVVTVFLLSSLMISIVVFGLRTTIAKRRAPLWVLGVITAGTVMVAGFIWSQISIPGRQSQQYEISRCN